ncbi:restriction endonuclease [Pontibacillus salipaludis]
MGEYVVTNGGYSRAAQEYAQGLKIELINGIELVIIG